MDRRPLIVGLDRDKLSNQMQTWFKFDGLYNFILQESTLSSSTVRKIVDKLQEEIFMGLDPYADELELSKNEVNVYIDALLDALGVTPDPEDYDNPIP